MKVLIDTCIIIDALQDRKPFSKYAQQIFLETAKRSFIGCITAKSITDIYYLTHKATHNDEATREILHKLFSLFEIIDTSAIDCIKAVSSPMKDYEDAVMSETASRNALDYIITRNVKDYSQSKIPVYMPESFLHLF